MSSEEHKHKLIAEKMKHKEQLVKVENEKELYKNSTSKLGKQKNELEVCVYVCVCACVHRTGGRLWLWMYVHKPIVNDNTHIMV